MSNTIVTAAVKKVIDANFISILYIFGTAGIVVYRVTKTPLRSQLEFCPDTALFWACLFCFHHLSQ